MSKKFRFRLSTVLRFRDAARDQCRVQLSESQRADLALQNQQERLDAEQKHLQNQCRAAAGPGAVDIDRLAEAHQCAAAVRLQQAELDRRRQALTDEIDRRRQSLIEADRDVRTLEKLHENQLQAHCQAENRQEAKRLDEAALQNRNDPSWQLNPL